MAQDTRRSVDDERIPDDLRARGFRLIVYDDGTLRAVSSRWGVSERRATIEEVIGCVDRLVAFLTWMEEKGNK